MVYCDGFAEPLGPDAVVWTPEAFFAWNGSRLHKLHGSVDWWRYRLDSGREVIARPNKGGVDPDHLRDDTGKLLPVRSEGRAYFLAGTFNKMLQYGSGIFADLHDSFGGILRQTDALVVSGYSFSDKGINSRLIYWMESERATRMVVVHEDPDSLREGSRFAVKNHWRTWVDDGRLQIVDRWIQDVSWQEVRDHLT